MAVCTATNRVPLSLRLPASIVENVEKYAADNKMSKTDAFLYFLQKGMQSEDEATVGGQLRDIQLRLDQIQRLVARSGNLSANQGDENESHIVEKMADVGSANHSHPASKNESILHVGAIEEAASEVASLFPAIRRVYLFGSFARGDANGESDVDLRLELDPDFAFSLHDAAQFAKRVEKKVLRPVDVVTAKTLKNPNLAHAIEREKVLIYER